MSAFDATRFGLASVMFAAAAAKALTLGEFRDALAEIEFIPTRSLSLLARLVPAVEFSIGVGLIILPRLGAATTCVLLLTFAAFAEVVRHQRRSVSCACFGVFSGSTLGRSTALRNVCLAMLAVTVVVSPPSWGRDSLPDTLIGVGAALNAALVMTLYREARRPEGEVTRLVSARGAETT